MKTENKQHHATYERPTNIEINLVLTGAIVGDGDRKF